MLKVGIIGLGIISNSHLKAYELINMATITAVCDIEMDKRREEFESKGIHCYSDYKEMLDKESLDMVDICLPTYLHKEAAIYSLNKGFHTLVEKPLAVNVEEIEEIEQAAAKSKGRIMVAHVSRFKPQSVYLKKLLDEGVLGEPKFFHTWRFSAYPEKRYHDWLQKESLGGGTIFDFQIHDIDLACWYFGEPVAFRSRKIAGKDLGSFITELEFANGCKVMMEISHVMPDKFSFTSGMSLLGSDGFAETSYRSDEEGYFDLTTYDARTKYHYTELPMQYCRNPYGEEIAHFIDCIEHDKPFMITLEDAKRTVATGRRLADIWSE